MLRTCALSGGDDYELVFTAPASARGAVEQAGKDSATRVTRIGRIDAEAGPAHRRCERRAGGAALRLVRPLRLILPASDQEPRTIACILR
jgi:hypothetical protein